MAKLPELEFEGRFEVAKEEWKLFINSSAGVLFEYYCERLIHELQTKLINLKINEVDAREVAALIGQIQMADDFLNWDIRDHEALFRDLEAPDDNSFAKH